MQNKPNFPKSQMNVNQYNTKNYEKFLPLAGQKNKPNSNPISSKAKIACQKTRPHPPFKVSCFILDLIIKQLIFIFYKAAITKNSLKRLSYRKDTKMSGKKQSKTSINNRISRRSMLQIAAGTGAAALGLNSCATLSTSTKQRAIEGRINQSIVYWCFEKHWDIERTCQIARQLGCKSIELVDPRYWPTLRKYGLVCALTGSHGFEKGMNNPEYHDMCLKELQDSIDACSQYGFPNVITFTGFRENIPDDVGITNCVNGYKRIISYAESKKVNLCLEMLNSRVATEMQGHPGYQGDHTDYCMEIIKRVGSSRMKLLFDIYHVQIMDGDIIARIRQYKDYIGHYHTAGNPGRCEIGDKQEINYKPIMEEIARTGYLGYVGQEFIPTGNPYRSLKEAVILCDV